jgi:4-hydroxybenzoate polyprenyltransferase
MVKHRQDILKEYAKLLRLYALPVISIIPIIGLLTLMDWGTITPGHILTLLLIGMFTHIYGHVLNEYMDIEIDKQSVELSKKPLVSGVIPRWHALAISVMALIGAIITCWFFFHDILVMSLLIMALLCAGLYNLFHKKLPGSDFFIASAVFFSFLFGASTSLQEFSALTYFIGILLFIRELYANSIESALKDVEHEVKIGIKTMPLLLGVRVHDGTLEIPRRFKVYVLSIESTFLIALIAGLYFFKIGNILWVTVLLIMILFLFYA